MVLIDELGLGDEILELHKKGKSARAIREELIKRHGNTYTPCKNTVYNFIVKHRNDEDRKQLTLNVKKDIKLIETKLELLIDELYVNGKTKYSNDLKKDFLQSMKVFYDFYSTKEEQIKELLLKWIDELLVLIPSTCQNEVKEKLLQLIKEA